MILSKFYLRRSGFTIKYVSEVNCISMYLFRNSVILCAYFCGMSLDSRESFFFEKSYLHLAGSSFEDLDQSDLDSNNYFEVQDHLYHFSRIKNGRNFVSSLTVEPEYSKTIFSYDYSGKYTPFLDKRAWVRISRSSKGRSRRTESSSLAA